MKKTKFLGMAALCLSLGLVGCDSEPEVKYETDKNYHWQVDEAGNVIPDSKVKHEYDGINTEKSEDASCEAAGKKVETCKVCGYDKESSISKKNHNYVEDSSQSKPPSCSEAGKKVEVCSDCGHKQETPLEKTAHNFGASSVIAEAVAETTSGVTKKVCADCGAVDIIVDATTYVANEGGFKSGGPEGTIKLDANGDNVTYSFSLDKAFSGSIYLMGQVDYWKDNQNNNESKTFKSRKSGEGYNIEIKVNDSLVNITNEKTYEQMGMDVGEKIGNVQYSTLALCEVGAASLNAGSNVINYKRIESFNLNITEIHFIGTFVD